MQIAVERPQRDPQRHRRIQGVSVPEHLQFLASCGFAVTLVLVLAAIRSAAPRVPGTNPLHTLEWLSLAIFVPVFAILEWASTNPPRVLSSFIANNASVRRLLRVWNASRPFCAGSLFVIAFAFMFLDAGAMLLFIALAQALMVYLLAQRFERSASWGLAVFGASFGAWVLSAHLSFTPMEKLLLDASPATGLVLPVLAAALCLLVVDVCGHSAPGGNRSALMTAVRYIVAGLVFLELGLRTDASLMDWVPYHQTYWTAPATFVRAGHYLLWDVPSQYGFLSELALAYFPAPNTWQALYELTALVLSAQALLLFGLLTTGRRGILNSLVSFLIASSIFFSSQATRYPFGPRLYPQGGLRFVWVLALLFVVYKIYASRDRNRVLLWRIAAWACWLVGSLWAFESLVWCTLIWGGFCGTEFLVWVCEQRQPLRAILWRLLSRFGPFIALGGLALGAIDLFYRARLGHGPDWTGYVEFSGLYAADARYHVPTETFGPGWIVVLLLGALSVPAILALRKRRYGVLALVVATWLATWGCAIYYFGEPYDNHINAITVVFGFAFAITSLVLSDLEVSGISLTRLAFVPIFAMLIATAYGEPARIADIRAPLLPGFQFNVLQRLPVISGELVTLFRIAGIQPDDRVILPNSPAWVKIDNGMIMPFVKSKDGAVHHVVGWLPEGPAGATNALYSLPLERRLMYIHRFLEISPNGGWYVTFRSKATCDQAAPSAVDASPVFHTANYSAVLCKINPSRLPFIVRKVVGEK